MSIDPVRILVRLAVRASRGDQLSQSDARQIESLLLLLAAERAGTDEEGLLALDRRRPGYLTRSIGDYTVFVPFNLANVFPPARLLAPLVGISAALKLDQEGTICISGSTTFLGKLVVIGDLDFCEYYLSPIANLPGKAARIWGRRLDDCRVASVRCRSLKLFDPWSNGEAQLSAVILPRGNSSALGTVKIEAVFFSAAMGVLPVSNMVLPLDKAAPEEGNAGKSFVFQEAVVVARGSPPRALLNPRNLGQYLEFLREEANNVLNDDPIKALKRVLSFALFVGRNDLARPLLDVLNTAAAAAAVIAKRTEALELMASEVPQALAARIREGLVSIPEGVERELQQTIYPSAKRLVGIVLSAIEEIYGIAAAGGAAS
jgi:hypothetical protein